VYTGGNVGAHPGSGWCGCGWTTPQGHSNPPVTPIGWRRCTELADDCKALVSGHKIIPAP
jgi:hypothetical protein